MQNVNSLIPPLMAVIDPTFLCVTWRGFVFFHKKRGSTMRLTFVVNVCDCHLPRLGKRLEIPVLLVVEVLV